MRVQSCCICLRGGPKVCNVDVWSGAGSTFWCTVKVQFSLVALGVGRFQVWESWKFKNGRGLCRFLDTLGLFERARSGFN